VLTVKSGAKHKHAEIATLQIMNTGFTFQKPQLKVVQLTKLFAASMVTLNAVSTVQPVNEMICALGQNVHSVNKDSSGGIQCSRTMEIP